MSISCSWFIISTNK